MGLGQSGGRSKGNRLGEGAVRRATPRERDGIDPPGHVEWEHVRAEQEREEHRWVLTSRGEKVMAVVAAGSWVFFCVLLAVVVCAWWGLL